MDTLQQRVADYPRRLRRITLQALDHAGAVVMAIDGERSVVVIAVATPQQLEVERNLFQCLVGVFHLGLEEGFFLACVFHPTQHTGGAVFLGGQLQLLQLASHESRIKLSTSFTRISKGHPEIVIDHVQRHLPTAHRPLDEAHDGELCFLEHEAITCLAWQLLKGDKRIGRARQLIRGQLVDGVSRFEEQLGPARQALLVQPVRHVGFHHHRFTQRRQAVIHPLHARIVIGTAGRNRFHRLPRRGGRTHHAEIRRLAAQISKIQIGQIQVLKHVAAHQLRLERILVEKGLPGIDLLLLLRANGNPPVIRCAFAQPLQHQLTLGITDFRQAIWHAPQRVFAAVVVELLDFCALLCARQAQVKTLWQGFAWR